MTKRFTLADIGFVYDNYNLLGMKEIVELLNILHEENQSMKKHIGELYGMIKVDVDNGIEAYPKILLEYIQNILKIIGDVE